MSLESIATVPVKDLVITSGINARTTAENKDRILKRLAFNLAEEEAEARYIRDTRNEFAERCNCTSSTLT